MERQETIRPDAPAQAEETERAQFENVFTPGYQEYSQSYQKVWWYAPSHWISMLLAVLVVGFALYVIFIQRVVTPMMLAALAVFIGLVLYRFLYMPRQQAKLTVRRMEENYGHAPEIRISFYGDRYVILNTASGGKSASSYAHIAYCAETRDTLILRTRQKQFVPLAKTGFIGGDIAAFKAFMRQKLPSAKFRWQ